MHTREEQLKAFDRLLTVMDELRENVHGIENRHSRVCDRTP